MGKKVLGEKVKRSCLSFIRKLAPSSKMAKLTLWILLALAIVPIIIQVAERGDKVFVGAEEDEVEGEEEEEEAATVEDDAVDMDDLDSDSTESNDYDSDSDQYCDGWA